MSPSSCVLRTVRSISDRPQRRTRTETSTRDIGRSCPPERRSSNSRFVADRNGDNPTAALFAGIRVPRVKFILFLLTGLMAGVAAVCLTSRLGSTRPSIAVGWELEVVTMVVLGGVNILGGSGTIPGVVLAAIVMGLVTFGFGLMNVPGIVMSIFIGLLLIGVIALPNLLRRFLSRRTSA